MAFVDELEQMTAAAPGKGAFTPASIIAAIRRGENVDANIKRLRYFLSQLGILGCGTTKRISAITVALGIPPGDFKRAIRRANDEEKATEEPPDVPESDLSSEPEYLPVGDCSDRYNPALCQEQAPEPQEGDFCEAPADWRTGEPETDDELPDLDCPTDTHQGCDDEDRAPGEEEPPQCDTARDIAGVLWDLIPPPPEQFPPFQETPRRINNDEPRPLPDAGILLSRKTIAEIAWKLQALQLNKTLRKCDNFVDDIDEIFMDLKAYIDGLPEGYINPYLLPYHPELPKPVNPVRTPEYVLADYTNAATAARQRAASSRRYKRGLEAT